MEQEIRFCTSADGTRIAYTSRGEGSPLLCCQTWSMFSIERGFSAEAMTHGRRVVLWDHRGTGSSQRDVEEISVEAQALDLAAVADELQLDHFDLWGDFDSSPVTITYAAHHPERVSRLILSGCYSHGGEVSPPESIRSLAELARSNWGVARRTLADLTFPKGPLEVLRQYAEMMRETYSPEVAARYLELFNDVDVRPLLARVSAPTLVLHPRGEFRLAANPVRAVAAEIPNARLATPDGVPTWASLAEVAGQFLDEDRSRVEDKQVSLPSGTAIILFLDIAGSTALTTKLGDAAYRERERELDASLRAAITEAGGTPVEGKVLGDGVMAVFTSARQAIEAAQRCRDLGHEADLPLCLGIHAGDVVREGNNVHGGAVQVAARVVDIAAPGEILVSATVRDLARTSAGVAFEDRGEHELKGIAEPQRLFAVRDSD